MDEIRQNACKKKRPTMMKIRVVITSMIVQVALAK